MRKWYANKVRPTHKKKKDHPRTGGTIGIYFHRPNKNAINDDVPKKGAGLIRCFSPVVVTATHHKYPFVIDSSKEVVVGSSSSSRTS